MVVSNHTGATRLLTTSSMSHGREKLAQLDPIYMAMDSKERLADGAMLIARFGARQGVAVQWDEHEVMPHDWPIVIPSQPYSKQCYFSWAEACSRSVEGERVTTKGTFTDLGSILILSLDMKSLTDAQFDGRKTPNERQAKCQPAGFRSAGSEVPALIKEFITHAGTACCEKSWTWYTP